MIKKEYRPIDCGFHDLLLDRATRRVKATLAYMHTHNVISRVVVIKDVYTKASEEFLLTADEEVIRLDQIISLDGIKVPVSGSC